MKREEQAQPTPAKKSALPHWLDVQTIALIGSIVTLGVFCQNGFSSLRQDMNVMRQEMTSMRQDMNTMRTELKGDIQFLRTELKGDIANLRTELKDDIANLRTELKDDIAGLRTELKGDIAGVRSDLRRLEDRTRAVEVAVVGIGARLDNHERLHAGAHGVAESAPSESEAEQAERLAQGG